MRLKKIKLVKINMIRQLINILKIKRVMAQHIAHRIDKTILKQNLRLTKLRFSKEHLKIA
jgi:hypothetical protein